MKKVLRMIGLVALASADIQSDSLALHNNERNNYGVPSVTWSADLAASAQAYAETMASTGTTSHSTNRVNVGENLAWGSGSSISVTSLGDLWIAEKQYFIPGTDFPDCSTTGSWHDVAHYTQLMWEQTTEIGCGIAQASSGRYNYVCHYSPQGNIDGEPVYTVGSSSSSSTPSASSSSSSPSSNENNEEGTVNDANNNQWPNNNNQNNQNNQWPNNNNQNNQWPNNNSQDNQNNQWPSTRTRTRASTSSPSTSTSTSTPATTTASSTPAAATGSSSTASQPSSSSSSSSSSPYTYSTSAPDASSSAFESDSLNAHNTARNAYGVPSLTWSASLAQTAQSYSQVMASTGTTSHSTGRVDVGENLAWQSGSGTTTLALVNRWLNEKQYYIAGQDFPNVSTTGNWESVAHYTQMMWRQTTQVGCGVSEGNNGMYYYVCHYYVQGNIMGQPVY